MVALASPCVARRGSIQTARYAGAAYVICVPMYECRRTFRLYAVLVRSLRM